MKKVMNKEEQLKIIFELQSLVRKLNWIIAMPTGSKVGGLVIGKEEFVAPIVRKTGPEEFNIMKPPTLN